MLSSSQWWKKPRFVILLFAGFVLLFQGCSQRHMRIDARFDRLDGLQEQDLVYYAGKQVGKVEDIDPAQNSGYLVHLVLDKDLESLPQKFNCLELADDPSRTGRKGIVIRPGSEGQYLLKDGAVVKGGCSFETWADTLQEQVEEGLQVLHDLARQAAESLESITKSDRYKQLQQDLKDLAKEIGEAAGMARDTVVEKVIPDLERRLKELKEKLQRYGEQEKIKPLEEQLEKIKRI